MANTTQPRVVCLTNIPAPYREKMHELISASAEVDYKVIYCAETEPNRLWKFDKGNYSQIYLSGKGGKMVHNNLSVFRILNDFNPEVVICTGYNPTMLYGFLWCLIKGKKFIPFTDGTFDSEINFSKAHKLVRRIVFRYSSAFLGASNGSFKLFSSYGIPRNKMFRSCLCINNADFDGPVQEREYDLMFSGQLIERKMPLFFAEVAKRVKDIKGSCNVLILGDGPLKQELTGRLQEFEINFTYAGFVQPHLLPQYYRRCNLFLFPTLTDPWGIVANEACAAGLPVITCENAGAADDLILNDYNGYILPLNADVWANQICKLLQDKEQMKRLSWNARKRVREYTHIKSATAILTSVKYALAVKA